MQMSTVIHLHKRLIHLLLIWAYANSYAVFPWTCRVRPSSGRNRNYVTNFVLFFVTGDYMKDKYDGATEVRVNKRGRLQVKNAQYNLPTANDLVYLDESPDYCIRNKTIGSFGQ